MAGGRQQETGTQFVGHATTRRRTWSKRKQSLNNSSCDGTETSAYPQCNATWPWPAGCNRRLQNRPLKKDDIIQAKAWTRQNNDDATLAQLPCPEEEKETISATGAAVSAECDTADVCAAVDAPSGTVKLSKSPKEHARKVAFDMDAVTIHQIPPYAEIYGLHPREFVFDRRYYMIPSVCALTSIGLSAVDKVGADDDEVEDSDSDSENDVWETFEATIDDEEMYRLAEALD